MKNNFFVLISLSILLVTSACNKKQQDAPAISVIETSGETNWDYMVVGNNDYFFINQTNYLPNSVMYFPDGGANYGSKEFAIVFDDQGLPDKVQVDDYIYKFENFDGNKVDIGVVTPDGSIDITREVEITFNWDEYKNGGINNTKWSDLIGWTGKVAGALPCALNVGKTSAVTGDQWPVGDLSCGNQLLDLSSKIEEGDELHSSFTAFSEKYSLERTNVKCESGDPQNCLLEAANTATTNLSNYASKIASMEEKIQLMESALIYGYGDIQITLTWDNTADLDLWVTDPFGEKISYENMESESGGQLDVDDTDGYGPENIFWPTGAAPAGNYLVQVDYFSGPGPSNYVILIQAGDSSEQYEGVISDGETLDIVSFNFAKGFTNFTKLESVQYNLKKSPKN